MSSIIKTGRHYRVDDVFYLIGKIILLPVCLFGLWFAHNGYESYSGLFECAIRRMSGFPCPGCGGTRAFYHLFRGELWESFRLNSAVLYGVAAYLHFMALAFYRRHTGKKREREISVQYYLYGAAAVLLAQWGFKMFRILYAIVNR